LGRIQQDVLEQSFDEHGSVKIVFVEFDTPTEVDLPFGMAGPEKSS
jgi:hypothetical protein